MAGKATPNTVRALYIYGFFLLVFIGVCYLHAIVGRVAFFTQDSYSLMALADDFLHGRPPNLEQYAEDLPVNPWPLAYPTLLCITSFGGIIPLHTGAYILQCTALAVILLYPVKHQKYRGWLVAFSTNSALWLLGHAWSELLFVVGTLLTAYALDAKPKLATWGAILALHARQPALPALAGGYLFSTNKKAARTPLIIAFLSALLYYGINFFYTLQPFGGPRTPVYKEGSAWLNQAAHAILNELCLVRDSENLWIILPQIALWGIIIRLARIKTESARFLLGTGLVYVAVTMASHAAIHFAEPLDARLLGPGFVLILASLLQSIRWIENRAYPITCTLLFLSLPFRGFFASDLSLLPTAKPIKNAQPSWSSTPIQSPKDNPTTEEGVTLGKALFFDQRLSGNKKISCASCHKPNLAFSENTQRVGQRNTPSLLDVAWQPALFWDGGVKNLESVSLAPLHSTNEMGGDLHTVITLMRTDPTYRHLVYAAFQTDTAETIHFLRALAQYQRTLISSGSKVDNPTWRPTTQELLGKSVFVQACQTCHTPPLYTDYKFYNIQQQTTVPYTPIQNLENGRYRITQKLEDLGAFKTPSLRNVAKTWPYMHNGKETHLENCLTHGTVSLEQLAAKQKTTTNQITQSLVLYLEALTDTIP